MNKLYLKILFTGFIILGLTLPVNAQRSNGLTVEGTVSVEEGSVEGAIIQMFRDGRRLDNYGIGANGRYRVELNYNHEWTLIFARPGNFPQKIVVDTKVSREVLQSDPLFPPFPVDIKLFTEISGIDRTFSENTVLKIYYSDRVDNFISDLYYNDAQIKHLIDQAILQSQMIDREADFLAGLTRAEMAELRREYDQLIKAAENEYRNEKFLDALDGYQAASRVFPKEQYPKDRIAEINDLLGLLMVAEEMQQALAERLQELLAQADALYDAQNYAEARNAYHRALSVDPANRHAQQRSGEIAEILRRQQADQEYRNLITQGDNSFRELLYMDAKNAFQQALRLKPDESYPQQRIGEIDNLLAQQSQNAERLKSYEDAVFQAELNFERQFYERAISYYETALTHQPGDEVATRRIQEIRDLMNELANRTLYDRVIRTADRAFQRSQYSEALSDYEQAAELLPNEEYPRNQIEKIQEIFAEQERLAAEAEAAEQARLAAMQAEQDRQYAQAVSRGDSLFNLNEYEPSRTAYQSALQVKPDETYPQQRIDEIGQILAQLLSAQQAYDAAISRADRDFGNENFDDAKAAFTEAQQAKPEESYPAEQIARIDSIVEERARLDAEAEAAEQARLAAIQAEQDRQYAQAVSRGDSLFNLNEYESSRTAYQSALQVKPDETYPQQRIDEIGQILVQLLSAQQAYDAAIARADREFGNENFDDAKISYTEVHQANPEESYPAEQIARIDSIVETRARLAAEAEAEAARLAAEAEAAEQARLAALQAEQDRQYAQAVSRGDSLFNLNEYEPSGTAYQSALQVKPDETYPQQRIDEIGQILAQLLSAQQAYDAAISRADREFGNENFDDAKAAYTEAQQAKPEESWPAEQIVRIDSIVEERARLAAEAEAAEQARLAAIQAEQDRQYAQAVSRGDSLFNLNEYEPSRTAYQSALQVKPDETYPQQRIEEIKGILQEFEHITREYQNAVTMADQQFNVRDYSNARTNYEKALEIRPEETYPKDKIAEVERILARQELDENYRTIILAADEFFNSESWDEAKNGYETALEIKPDESYPRSQIVKIDNLLRQQQERELAEQRAAEDMERRRAEIEQRQREMSERQDMSETGLNQLYDEYIQLADGFFDNQRYNVSRAWYFKAWDVKPRETYPPQRIEEINRIVNSLLLSQRDRDYQSFVNLADSTFRENQLAVARGWYNRALTIKPNENYPKEQLQAIAGLIEERMAGRSGELFNSHMQNATEAYENGNYNVARFWYRKALELRPDDDQAREGLRQLEETIR